MLLCKSNVPNIPMKTHSRENDRQDKEDTGHVDAAAIVEAYGIPPLIERVAPENENNAPQELCDTWQEIGTMNVNAESAMDVEYAILTLQLEMTMNSTDVLICNAEPLADKKMESGDLTTGFKQLLYSTPLHFIDNLVYNMHIDRANGPSSLIDMCPTAFIFLSHLDLADIPVTLPLSYSPSPEYMPSSPVYIPSSPVLSLPPSPSSSVCTCTCEADCHAV
ncbi:hypothetical protein SCP_1402500 [Sparassis crispa]|uniref:Uncharacterized protein n=1 Tax=Sparassis crispa TaxID=139825 RepID=A0A401H366_9APHY|nr:hypothetical protein SCP_1402500 [Sparassis crispa]GBE88842.1 hypothetical protein SCP_1402500 [Sparassis crispa]